jgi:hypothetical protein
MNSLFLRATKLNTPTPPKLYFFFCSKNIFDTKMLYEEEKEKSRNSLLKREIPPKSGRSLLILWEKIALNKLFPFYTNKLPTIPL